MDFCNNTIHLLHNFVNKTCNIPLSNTSFPGGLPISISRQMLRRVNGLYSNMYLEYVLSYKADGQRQYLGFICIEGEFITFLQERNGHFKKIDLKVYPIAYEGTLFDVELLEDNTLLIFDCACINGNICQAEFYPNRLELARVFLHTSKQECRIFSSEIARNRIDGEYKSNYKDIIIRSKSWNLKVKAIFYASAISKLPSKWIYKDDGFIWTLATSKFHVYRCEKHSVLKWKPPDRITVDFIITANTMDIEFYKDITEIPTHLSDIYRSKTGSHKLLINHDDKVIWFSSMNTDVKYGVYECSWDSGKKKWYIELARLDKTHGNSLNTVVNTLENIEECLTRQDVNNLV